MAQEAQNVDMTEQESLSVTTSESIVDDIVAPDPSGEDPFAELVSDDRIDMASVEEEPSIPAPREEISDKDNPDSYKYWQSKYDTQVNETKEIYNRMTELEQVAPIANYLNQNPQVVKALEEQLSNDQIQESTGSSLKKPERPEKPTNYDAIDAYSDPDSVSYKYRESVDGYRDDTLAYYEAQQEAQRVAYEQEATVRQRAQAEQQRVAQMRNLYGDLTTNRGFSGEEAQSFMTEMSAPESISLDNLVNLWKLRHAPSREEITVKSKAEAMQREKERLSIPRPVGVTPGHDAQAGKTEEDRLMESMVQDFDNRNPWT
jgi:hypothetical protein